MVGECAACAADGSHGDLIAHKSERTGKRFIRCTNYDICNTSYPLPQRGEIHATGETCPDCGAPIVEIVTQRGPWRICVNMNCPGKEKRAAERKTRGRTSTGKKSTAKKTGKKSTAKKTTKKSTAKKSTTKKSSTKKSAKKKSDADSGAADAE